jgi:5-methyltetrahydropteroyltriglutamate--homocysteine methyltransferase
MPEDRILTTHVGRLARNEELVDAMLARPNGRPEDSAFLLTLDEAVTEAVRYQASLGIDIVSDGELGRLGWMVYHRDRLTGFAPPDPATLAGTGRIGRGSDFQNFAAYYADAQENWVFRRWAKLAPSRTVCAGPIKYVGQAALARDIATLQTAMRRASVTTGFMNATSPGSVQSPNLHYATDQDYLFAIADALNEEYRTITDAGLMLQIDDPTIADHWSAAAPDVDLMRYYDWAELRVEALNRALRGVPRDRVRLHVCWGSWHGPHSTDIPMRDLIPVLLKMDVGGYSVEAANARHEHEFEAWRDVDLDGRFMLPGVVSHATDTVEHEELVAWRIGLWTDVVGPERVIATTDCGLGDRVHPQIERAKISALVKGARLASDRIARR